jgi:chemotaxis protein CheX
VEISNKIIESAKEIFSTMVMMEISVNGDQMESSILLTESISGVIGMAGTNKGVLAIHIPNKVAMAITSSFLGMDVAELDDDVKARHRGNCKYGRRKYKGFLWEN